VFVKLELSFIPQRLCPAFLFIRGLFRFVHKKEYRLVPIGVSGKKYNSLSIPLAGNLRKNPAWSFLAFFAQYSLTVCSH
jgi:hypothetical protein